jgi:hypothetical protein
MFRLFSLTNSRDREAMVVSKFFASFRFRLLQANNFTFFSPAGFAIAASFDKM